MASLRRGRSGDGVALLLALLACVSCKGQTGPAGPPDSGNDDHPVVVEDAPVQEDVPE